MASRRPEHSRPPQSDLVEGGLGRPPMDSWSMSPQGVCWAHLDTATNIRGSAKRNAAFTLQHGAMLTPRQPEGCVPVVASRCALSVFGGKLFFTLNLSTSNLPALLWTVSYLS